MKKIFTFVALLLIISLSYANSIFSEIGFVETNYGLDNFSVGMGNTGIATTFRRNFSMSNPALNSTIYKAGFFTQISIDNLKFKNTNDSFDKYSTNFPDAKVIIPLMKNTILGFDLLQKYSYGLEISNSDSLANIGNYGATTTLKGSVNQFGISITRKINEMSLGFKLGLNYGNRYDGFDIDFEDNDLIDYDASYQRIMKGMNFTFGFTYPISKFSVGGFYESAIDLESNNTEKVDYVDDSDYDFIRETNSDYTLPSQLGLGAGVEISKEFYFETNFRERFWTDATNSSMNDRNTKIISAGLSFIPYRRDKLIPVRIGGYYRELPCKSLNSYVNEQAISLGLDVPLDYKKHGKISIALIYGSRGSVSDNDREDEFFRFSIGFQSFDRWLNPQNYQREKEIPEADPNYLEEWE